MMKPGTRIRNNKKAAKGLKIDTPGLRIPDYHEKSIGTNAKNEEIITQSFWCKTLNETRSYFERFRDREEGV